MKKKIEFSIRSIKDGKSLSCPNASPIKALGDKPIGHPLKQREFPLRACGKDGR